MSLEYEIIEERIPTNCQDVEAAILLLSLMSEISEDHYCAGWLINLEFILWETIFESPNKYFGDSPISIANIAKLLELTYRCQGWWTWSDDQKGETFLPYEEWLPIYSESWKLY